MPVGEEAVLGPRPVFMPQAGDSEARFRAGAEKEESRHQNKIKDWIQCRETAGEQKEKHAASGTGVVRRMVLCSVALEGRDTSLKESQVCL